MSTTNKSKIKIIYALFMVILATVTVVVAIKAVSVWRTGKALKQTEESARRLREDEGLNSEGSRSRAPYVMFRPEPNRKTMPMINSLGFHSPEITKEKAVDEYRIAILGGSVVFTNGPQYFSDPSNKFDDQYLKHSIIGILAKILKERLPGLRDKKVTFINAGIPSGVSGQELAQLQHHVIPLNIDLLVIYDGFNDFYIPFSYEKRPGYPYDYVVEEYRYLKGREGIAGKDALQNMGKMYQELGITIPGTDEAKKGVLEKYLFNIASMVNLAEGFGIQTGVFLQPYSERNVNPLLSVNNHHPIKLYKAARKAFGVLGRNNNSKVVFQDMTYMNDRLDGWFTDIAHTWWNRSHHMIAEEMFNHLDAAGMFENLKGKTVRPLGDESSTQTVKPSRYFDRIQEVLTTAGAGLKGDFTEKELKEFESIGYPGMGDLAVKALAEYYGGEIPTGLKKTISDELINGKSLLNREKDRQNIRRIDADDALKLKDVDLSADLCTGGLPFSGGDYSGYPAAMAFDNNETTPWSSVQGGPNVAGAAYIGYDFGIGKKHAVRRVTLKQGGRVEKLRVQSKVKADDQWADVATAVKYNRGGMDIIELVKSPAARYWRLLAASNAGNAPATWTVYEIQLIEKK